MLIVWHTCQGWVKALSHFVTRAGSVVPMYYSDLGNLQVAEGVRCAHDRGNPQEAVLT
jgi:hypothetical protein